ncbi:Nup85 Nucleoporin, putative [Acanthamoeba castellanii str. Neff]|uniref:Nuclear pore complex protein Nup85 n=1 Tax=Acanthamoeba castellanii (strain ATCC 30010 / Neff) TaxID=1257118 RepID=L8HEH3_ACACF|nr:Nup85 Nucleoporin, putative [Acanthamoeba castellanii str. Neff]ELR22811.1 Nup85 Nucleoporin, putative [Acanthamoeba castellanii str. Neff]
MDHGEDDEDQDAQELNAMMAQGRKRLGFCWGRHGNEFLLWKTQPRNERELKQKQKQPQPEALGLDSVWTGNLEAPLAETHKLFSEAHTVFLELQKFAVEFSNKPELMREATKKSSKNYRVVINILINNLQRKLERLNGKVEMDDESDKSAEQLREELGSQLALWKIAEIVWHLCDIFFISSKPESVITEPLVTWLQHFDVNINGETKSKEELDYLIREIVSSPAPDQHDSYWPVFYKLVLRGQILKALELLYAHSERRTQTQTKRRVAKSTKNNIWLKTEVLLKHTPVLREGESLMQFEADWDQWRADCRSLQAQAESKGDDDLLALFTLLSGDEGALRDLSSNWQEFLVARLLYAEPTTKNVEFRYLTEQATRHFSPAKDSFDQILLHVMNFEPYEAVKESWELLRWWFAAHLTDLLAHAGLIEDVQLDEGGNMREYFLVGFVRDELLASNKTQSMWRLGVNYLSFCPSFGTAYMKHLLEQIPLESEKQAYKALAVCGQHNLVDQAKLLYMIMGMQKYRERRYGASIQWFLRAAHHSRLSQVANKLVDDYYQGKSINADEVTAVVEQLDKDFIFSERLVFLSKVRDLNIFKEQKNWRAVAELTVEVISKKPGSSPLLDPTPSRSPTPVLFDFYQTELLMASLEDITSAHYSKGYTKNISDDELVAIRLALARNRARAICL